MQSESSKEIFLSPAKVNLCLRVVGKRNDGYHDIISLMQPITLFDELSILVDHGKGISVTCSNPYVPKDDRNLAHKAAALFLKETDLRKRVSIYIKKNIPVAAGLGGGSSNAATTLMGLNSVTGVALKEDEMLKMASSLGSDVPFFILRSAAVAKGRGELVERIDMPSYWYLLINPGYGVSTAWAYKNLNLTKAEPGIRLNNLKSIKNFNFRIKDILKNDLEGVVLSKYPELRHLKDMLCNVQADGVLMAGSGPTLFALFFEEDRARCAFERLNQSLNRRVSLFLAQGINA